MCIRDRTYIGPVDGHNIDELIRITEDALKIEHPVLIHVPVSYTHLDVYKRQRCGSVYQRKF